MSPQSALTLFIYSSRPYSTCMHRSYLGSVPNRKVPRPPPNFMHAADPHLEMPFVSWRRRDIAIHTSGRAIPRFLPYGERGHYTVRTQVLIHDTTLLCTKLERISPGPSRDPPLFLSSSCDLPFPLPYPPHLRFGARTHSRMHAR